MDDTTLRTLSERLTYLRNLGQRKEEVKKAISEQEKLTEKELSKAIDEARILPEVEDLYRPYKQSAAPGQPWPRRRGWSPLAVKLYLQVKTAQPPEVLAGMGHRQWHRRA